MTWLALEYLESLACASSLLRSKSEKWIVKSIQPYWAGQGLASYDIPLLCDIVSGVSDDLTCEPVGQPCSQVAVACRLSLIPLTP